MGKNKIIMKGAIFDMDGLMFDTEAIWQKNWNALAKERGFELPDNFKYEICGSNGEKMYGILRKYFVNDDPKELYEECLSRLESDLEIDVPVKEGIKEILDYFKDNNYKIAVASSAKSIRINKNLEKTGLTDYFDAIIGGGDLSIGKPNPEIFIKAAEKIGLETKECYVFEDAYNGVMAGYNAGCKTIMIPDLMEPNEEIKKMCTVYPSLLTALEEIKKDN